MTEPSSPSEKAPDTTEATEAVRGRPRRRRRVVAALGIVVSVAIISTLAYFWKQSLLPETYSVMDMGYHDYGGGPVPQSMAGMDGSAHQMSGMEHGGSGQPISVETLTGPSGDPDESVTLTVREEDVELGGEGDPSVSGYTINHSSPGPTIVVHAGDLLEVTLVNESVSDGITLHWHGVDVPNAEDGVAGVTQDAVEKGEKHVYRFVVDDAGTYWYHSHQVSDEQVSHGLFGALVVLPKGSAGVVTDGSEPGSLPEQEALAVVHNYDGNRTVNGVVGTDHVTAEPGDDVVVRVVNTNDGPLRTWVTGSSYVVTAIDARPLNEPTPVSGTTIVVPAGGRADLVVTAPDDGRAAVVDFGGETRLAVGPEGAGLVEGEDPERDLDLLTYGEPAALPFDPAEADRRFTYSIGRRPAFLDGKPGFWWTINGHLYPDIPMYVVEEGDIVVMTIENHSGQVHPMHLHGHHAVVLSRDGVKASGSPWWIDSLDVQDDEQFDIAFVADNPGVWMDHCHNLPHASQGLVTHLMYADVTTPFMIGGTHSNDPE